MINFDDLENQIKENKYSCENIFYHSLESLDGNFQVTNATMPLIALLEHQSVCAAVNNSEIDTVNRYLNPEYCDTLEGLARHLDYSVLNTIFATPGKLTKTTITLSLDDISRLGVDIGNNRKKVIIPEDTIIGYKDSIYYGIHHPISIVMVDDLTIDVNYIENDSPLMPLSNPIIESRLIKAADTVNGFSTILLELDIEAYQFKRSYYDYTVTSSQGFSKNIIITDQFYCARVFTRRVSKGVSVWQELDVYFSEFIYNSNSNNGAAIVKLNGSVLTIDIPQIYISKGLIGTDVQVRVYTTKGDYEQDYASSLPTDFSISFSNNDSTISNFVSPLEGFRIIYVGSKGIIEGGNDIISVDSLREKVLLSDDAEQAITEEQLYFRLNELGYTVEKEVNYVSDVMYTASKRLNDIALDDTSLVVSGGSFDITIEDLEDKYGVINNGSNYTITPNSIFKYTNGIISLLTNEEKATLLDKSTDALLTTLNTEHYMTSPFYYLIEKAGYNKEISIFNMDSPTVDKRVFEGSNVTSVGRINTSSYTLTKTTTGFKLSIVATVNDSFKEYEDDSFTAQLSRTDENNRIYAMNATNLGRGSEGEYLFEFNINCTYDLSYLNTLVLDNLHGTFENYVAKLTDQFKLTYNLTRNLPAELDEYFKEYTREDILPDEYQTITLETLTITFGTQLDRIYSPIRTFLGAPIYLTHSADVPAHYAEDIYEVDENGLLTFVKNPNYGVVEGERPLIYNLLHAKGDPILDADGNQIFKARKGDIIIENGVPVTDGKERHNIQTKILLVDYKYSYEPDYYTQVVDEVLNNLNSDIAPLSDKMLGLTELTYNLSKSIGNVEVTYGNDEFGLVEASMEFDIVVKVDDVTYADGDLRNLISGKIRSTIANYLNTTNFAANKLTSLINAEIENNVVSFHIASINGRDNLTDFKLVSGSDTIGVKSKLVVNVDNTISLSDAINITYKLG